MNRRTFAPIVASLAAFLVLASACSTAAPPAFTRAPASPDLPKPAQTPASSPVMLGDIADLLVLRMARPTSNAAYTVIEPGEGRILFNLADGIVSRDWHTLVTLAPDGASTRIQVTTPEGGDLPRHVSVPGAWRLPTIGVTKQAVGLSADGTSLVLEEAIDPVPASPAKTARTRFALVDTSGSKAPRVVTLDGAFVFDALSPDGRFLYLLEYPGGADPTHYQVRRLDVATGALQDGAIVDKRNIDEQMNGYALTQEVGRNGMTYTLYRGPTGAFIHALDTTQGIAFCIDLPGTEDESSDRNGDWSLVADPSGSFLYVTDPAEHRVSAIDLTDYTIAREKQIGSLPSIVFAKLESTKPAGGRAALSPDGTTLYVIDGTGVAVVRVADLITTGHVGGTGVYRSIAVGSAGTVYAVDTAGRALALGPNQAVPIGNGTYASIVGIVAMH
jgi:hypothetical protein